jgi:hypothetical protein
MDSASKSMRLEFRPSVVPDAVNSQNRICEHSSRKPPSLNLEHASNVVCGMIAAMDTVMSLGVIRRAAFLQSVSLLVSS